MYNNENYCSMAEIIAVSKSKEKGTKRSGGRVQDPPLQTNVVAEFISALWVGMKLAPEGSHGWEIGIMNW